MPLRTGAAPAPARPDAGARPASRRRPQVTPLQWAQRLAAPHAQLADILARQGEAAADDARKNATDADRALVERFLEQGA